MEDRHGKRQVRSGVLLLIGEADKIYWSMIVAKCKVTGKVGEDYGPLLPLYRLLNPHLSEIDEVEYVSLCRSATERLIELGGLGAICSTALKNPVHLQKVGQHLPCILKAVLEHLFLPLIAASINMGLDDADSSF
jgi:hypothetical protein